MSDLLLNAITREKTGKQVAELRQGGMIPAVLYGKKIENQNLLVKDVEFNKMLESAGESTLIDLKVGEAESVKVLIYNTQRDAVKHNIIHADFYQVRMDEAITATVSLVFVGEAPAVKEFGGLLLTNIQELEVKCLPGDLVHDIQIDLSVLKTFDDKITVESLGFGDKLEIQASPNSVIATVVEPRQQEEDVVAEGEAPIVEGEKKEGEAEGETKPEATENKK